MFNITLKNIVKPIILAGIAALGIVLGQLWSQSGAIDNNRAVMADSVRHKAFVADAGKRIKRACLSPPPISSEAYDSCMQNGVKNLKNSMSDNLGYSVNDRLQVESEVQFELRLK